MGSASSNLSLLSRKSVQPLGTDSSFIPYPGKLDRKFCIIFIQDIVECYVAYLESEDKLKFDC